MPGVKKVATVALLQQLSTICWVDGGSQANVINQVWGLWSVDKALCKIQNQLLNCSHWTAGLTLTCRVCKRLNGNCLAIGLLCGVFGINQSGSNAHCGG